MQFDFVFRYDFLVDFLTLHVILIAIFSIVFFRLKGRMEKACLQSIAHV